MPLYIPSTGCVGAPSSPKLGMHVGKKDVCGTHTTVRNSVVLKGGPVTVCKQPNYPMVQLNARVKALWEERATSPGVN